MAAPGGSNSKITHEYLNFQSDRIEHVLASHRVQVRVDDYLKMGVPYVWVLDPKTKAAWAITPELGWREEKSGVLKTTGPDIEVPLVEISEEAD